MPRPLRYLALGDSYTIGEGVAPRDRWPEQLARLLRDAGVEIDGPELIARTGWTASELDLAIDAATPTGPYDVVSLLIGVNDQYRGLPIARYRLDFERLLGRAVALAGVHPESVFVVSIPDWGVTPFAFGRDRAGIAAEIDAFNEVNREACAHTHVAWVDVTAQSRRLPRSVVSDGLHPDPAQYAAWARVILPSALTAISAIR